MKKIITLLLLSAVCLVNGQAFKGKGDVKAQVGANIQKGGTGIHLTYDAGVGENMSFGATASFLLSASEGNASDIPFGDKIDIKARFNANIGKVLTLGDKADIYPGLDLSLRNFGAHLGGRYFFSDGFGMYSEIGFPIAKYNQDKDGLYNNQFVLNVGVSFNL